MLHVIRIVAESTFAPLVEAGLELAAIEMTAWQGVAGDACFERYAESRPAAEVEADTLRAHLTEWACGERWTVTVEELPDHAWREAWKRFFRSEQVSPQIVIRPPWEPAIRDVRCVVTINPGLSFGTGTHFTTRSCLDMLDRLSLERPGATLLDVGCGSGILAIAAVKLGFTRVTAFDVDPIAVEVALENAAINAVSDQLTIMQGGLDARDPAQGTFDVVVGNLYDEVLRRYAPRLVSLAAPGRHARVVVAGMLRAQFPAVQAAFAACGFVPEETPQDEEWASGCFRRGG